MFCSELKDIDNDHDNDDEDAAADDDCVLDDDDDDDFVERKGEGAPNANGKEYSNQPSKHRCIKIPINIMVHFQQKVEDFHRKKTI